MIRAKPERLRESFAGLLRGQVSEAQQLVQGVADDPDLGDALGEMLSRTRDTARALGLDDVAAAAATVLASLADPSDGADRALDALQAAWRSLDTTADLQRPLVFLEGEGLNAASNPDPGAARVADLPALLECVRAQRPLAAVAPVAALAAVRAALDLLHPGLPLYVYGPEGGLSVRAEAAGAGAAGYFATPVDARWLARRVRARAMPGAPDRVLFVGPAADADGWIAGLGPDAEVTVLESAEGLLDRLDTLDPSLVLLADPRTDDLVAVLSGHPEWWDLPRVIVGAGPAAPEHSSPQLRALLARARQDRELRAEERSTGVLPRAAFARALEREVAWARRGRSTLAVARCELHEPRAGLRPAAPADATAARVLARILLATFRDCDIVGRVGDSGFGVLLRGATRDGGHARLQEVERVFSAAIAEAPALTGYTVTSGVSDTTHRDDALLEAAERDRLLGAGRCG